MGAYLSTPVTSTKSDDFIDSNKYICGLSGMQGWRISMEDAYNCVPQMDTDTGFFAVYDGHGGGEVAIYCSHHFIDVLKNTEGYRTGKIGEALKSTFMEIDEKLRDPNVKKELKLLSQMEPGDPPITEEDIKKLEEQEKKEKEEVEDETKLLYEEATMSIEELLAKYGRVANETESKLRAINNENNSSSSITTKNSETEDSDTEVAESDTNSQDDSSAKESENEKTAEKKQSSDESSKEISDKKTEITSIVVGDAENGKVNDEVDKGGNVDEKGDVNESKKTFLKTFPKPKPKVEDDEDSEDDDYEGFESDEAVEGSSSDEDDVDEDEDEREEEESSWVVEKEEEANENEPPRLDSGIEEPGADSGTTAVVAVLRRIDLYVANAGDSRCVLCRKDGVAYNMSDDHKPEDENELARITAAGGHVNEQGRVNGGLNLSRALGDHSYKMNPDLPLEKQMISALPDLQHVTLQPDDEFLVIACDGIWNALSSQEVVDFIRHRLNSEPVDGEKEESTKQTKLSTICEELFQTCLAPNTAGDGTGCDNMTCIIVQFKHDWLRSAHRDANGSENIQSGQVKDSNTELTKSNKRLLSEPTVNGTPSKQVKVE